MLSTGLLDCVLRGRSRSKWSACDQLAAHVVAVDGRELERVEGKCRRRLHLQETAQPGVGDVELLVEHLRRAGYIDCRGAAKVDARGTIAAQLLQAGQEGAAELDIR